MVENSRNQVHAMRGAVCKRDAARVGMNEIGELLPDLFGLEEPTIPGDVAMLCHFVVITFSLPSSKK
jgi:hypothetical protein